MRVVDDSDFILKGAGTNAGSEVFDTLLEIRAHCEKNPRDKDKFFLVCVRDNQGTADGIARSITQANTNKERPGNQKVPGGYWIGKRSRERNAEGNYEIAARYLGTKITSDHPEFAG